MKNLKAALNVCRRQIQRDKSFQSKVNEFNSLPYNERQRLSNKHKGYKQSLPFLSDVGKTEIIDQLN